MVIIGSGPAGYTAALYAGRANLRPVLLEGVMSGVSGGQLMTTGEVENYPGFPAGITGPELMDAMRSQAERWGAKIICDDAIAVDLDTSPYVISTSSSGTLRAHSVIIATGASAKRLRIPGEEELWGRGISACAICDGAAPIFAGAPVAVVGGGDSAAEEAVYLCKYASHVHLLVRGSKMKASATLSDRVFKHPNVTVHFNTVVESAISQEQLVSSASAIMDDEQGGGGRGGRNAVAARQRQIANGNGVSNSSSPLHGLRVRRLDTGEESDLVVKGLFYAIGHTPNTQFLRGSSRLRFDRAGYLLTGNKVAGGLGKYGEITPYTGQDGILVAGDCADPMWRQAVTAAGSGCMAALAAERYLAERGLIIEYHQEEPLPESSVAARVAEESAQEQAANARGNDDESNYNADETWHSGQLALRKLYHESSRPLIVKYVSPTCGPCRQLKPMLQSVVRAYEGRVHYVEIDITKDAEIAEAAGVTGSPTVQIFHEKSLIKELKGVKMKSDYRTVVESLLN